MDSEGSGLESGASGLESEGSGFGVWRFWFGSELGSRDSGVVPGHPLDERVVRLLVPPPGEIACVTCGPFLVDSSGLI